MQCCLVCIQSYTATSQSNFTTLSSPPKQAPHPLAINPHSRPWQPRPGNPEQLTQFLTVRFYLLWIFHKNEILQSMIFASGFFHCPSQWKKLAWTVKDNAKVYSCYSMYQYFLPLCYRTTFVIQIHNILGSHTCRPLGWFYFWLLWRCAALSSCVQVFGGH